ncbi:MULTISPECIES: LexA family transcriptional regulator [unclassified Oceanicaulis]|uniref:helix-turn-helix domain-containing protein n=1 Tax=unclassified Oceanicaulis TaxID=2632123 RepID=UPI0025F1F8B0|nr:MULTISPECIES: LexA family transcriptional regulator [unclassified Oceanicaulis]
MSATIQNVSRTYKTFCLAECDTERLMNEMYERLQAARRCAGYANATDAARAFGWNETTYRAHESGRRGLKNEVAVRYAKAFRTDEAWLLTGKGTPPKGVDVKHNRDHGKALIEVHSSGEIPVIGEIAAGVWQEAIEMLDTGESIPFIPHPRFPKDAQLALRVRGDSCDLIAQPGAYVNTVPLEMALPVDGLEGLLREFEAKGRDLIVVAERLRGGLVEATLKALVRDRAGYALEARSSNPKWAGKIPLTDDMLRDGDETRIARVMIGKYEVML